MCSCGHNMHRFQRLLFIRSKQSTVFYSILLLFCCCYLFSSLLHGKFYIFFVSSVLFVVIMCICPMSTLTKEGDLYASTHLRQLLLLVLLLLLPILMKTEIFISIHFYFRSSKVISHRSICSKPFRLYSPKKR